MATRCLWSFMPGRSLHVAGIRASMNCTSGGADLKLHDCPCSRTHRDHRRKRYARSVIDRLTRAHEASQP